MTKIDPTMVRRPARALTPDYQQAIKEVLSVELGPKDYARQVDLFCKRRSVEVISPCQYIDARFEIVLPAILPYETLRMVMTEMDIILRVTGTVDLFVMSSSLGLKLIAKQRTTPPIIVTQEHPVTYSVEASFASALQSVMKVPTITDVKALLKSTVSWLDKQDQSALRKKLVKLVQEIDDLVDDQEARIEHESKLMHDELLPKVKELESLIARIEKLDEKGNLPLKIPTIKQHFQSRFRLPLSKCALWTKKITDTLGDGGTSA